MRRGAGQLPQSLLKTSPPLPLRRLRVRRLGRVGGLLSLLRVVGHTPRLRKRLGRGVRLGPDPPPERAARDEGTNGCAQAMHSKERQRRTVVLGLSQTGRGRTLQRGLGGVGPGSQLRRARRRAHALVVRPRIYARGRSWLVQRQAWGEDCRAEISQNRIIALVKDDILRLSDGGVEDKRRSGAQFEPRARVSEAQGAGCTATGFKFHSRLRGVPCRRRAD